MKTNEMQSIVLMTLTIKLKEMNTAVGRNISI